MRKMTINRFSISFLLGFLVVPFLYAQEKSDYIQTSHNLSEQPYIRWLITHSEKEITLLGGADMQKPDTLHLPARSFGAASLFANRSLPQVDYYLQQYQNQINTHLLFHLIHTYLYQIKDIGVPVGLPEGLLLVPAVCSGLNPESVNALGGTGFWHLNYPQALKYGLTVNDELDDRKNLKRATPAALSYLNHLYTIYGNWELALAAYACGPVTVNNLLERHAATTYQEIYDKLPAGLRDLPGALEALLQVWVRESENVPAKMLFPEADTVKITRKLSFSTVKAILGIDSTDLAFLNPTLLHEYFPSDFTASIPNGLKPQFELQKDSLYVYQDSIVQTQKTEFVQPALASQKESTIYKVKSGDVLGSIAERYGVRVREIQDWNNLRTTRIDIGQELIIYGSNLTAAKGEAASVSKSAKKTEAKPGKKSNFEYITYTVKSGDNLWLIARKFPGISAQNIMDLNGIDENIQVGQQLKIKLKQ